MPPYKGRFAPSPTGPLHAGSLVAALASWLDARAHHGQWFVRIEDLDAPRCAPGADSHLLHQLALCKLVPDAPPVWQSSRGALYQQALDKLTQLNHAYPCACSRKDIEVAQLALGVPRVRNTELVYPGTCRNGLDGRLPRAWRFRARALTHWVDRRLGPLHQNVVREVGDFVLKRADGVWAYQLGVVVDDADQGITHVVRGEDLADNTARQIQLQTALALPHPSYLHAPLVLGTNGEKLSKQNGAPALDLDNPLAALHAAANVLGLSTRASSTEQALAQWVNEWRKTWVQGLLQSDG
jgi:glutamyl-Q tRNA(Asp) synthetase